MKRLILMRHAKTEAWGPGIDDHGRALTPAGHEASQMMADVLAQMGWVPDHAYVSSARRTRETWKHLAAVFGACEMTVEDDLYLAGERGIRDYIADAEDVPTLMIVGHNPGIHDLAQLLMRSAGSTDIQAAQRLASKMPTGSMALYEADADAPFANQRYQLRRFIRPKDLQD